MIAGSDSRAQIAIQAAERLRELGEGVPWEVSPPLPVWLIWPLTAIPGVTPWASVLRLCGAAPCLLIARFASRIWMVAAHYSRLARSWGDAARAPLTRAMPARSDQDCACPKPCASSSARQASPWS